MKDNIRRINLIKLHFVCTLKNVTIRAGEMAQQLRALTALPRGLISSTHITPHNHL